MLNVETIRRGSVSVCLTPTRRFFFFSFFEGFLIRPELGLLLYLFVYYMAESLVWVSRYFLSLGDTRQNAELLWKTKKFLCCGGVKELRLTLNVFATRCMYILFGFWVDQINSVHWQPRKMLNIYSLSQPVQRTHKDLHLWTHLTRWQTIPLFLFFYLFLRFL